MRFLRRSLFFQFYAVVLGSLALVAFLLVAMAAIGRFDGHDSIAERMDTFIGTPLPAPDNRRELQESVRHMGDAADADVSVYDRNGRLLAHAGPPVPFEARPRDRDGGFRPPPRILAFDTPNGLHVVARNRAPFGAHRRNVVLIIILIAASLGIVAFPVTRKLTRRLENLKTGMDTWSAGALDRRVAVEGNDEIADVARTFNRAAARIEELVTAQKSLLANASHELRSPLARLRIAVEMFEDAPSDRLKAEIVGNLHELDELVDEILMMSRLESRQPETLDEDCDLLAIAAEEAARAGASVSGDQVTIKGNAKLLTRLVRNLLQNAARHGKPPIDVTVTAMPGKLKLAVTDRGHGLNGVEADRVFEPFYRPPGHGESAGGWGLGLALVRQIAELHDGKASYQSPSEGGARFVVEFPRTGRD